jgi:hypothetical protein
LGSRLLQRNLRIPWEGEPLTVDIKNDRLEEITAALQALAATELLVGVPASRTDRGDEGGPTNALLAYVHNYGCPSRNIPARPFIEPAIAAKRERCIDLMKKAAKLALDGKRASAISQFHVLGMEIQNEMKETISRGIPPPIKDATVFYRKQGRKSQHMRPAEVAYFVERAKGKSPHVLQTQRGHYGLITPLINTGALLNSLSYVVRTR